MCGCCSRVRMCPPREVSRLPFLDTDIARGLFLLTIDDFFFFCNEFGIDAFRPACAMEGSSTDQYYVCLCKHTVRRQSVSGAGRRPPRQTHDVRHTPTRRHRGDQSTSL
mmetsp:Transcript_13550/g.39068  ORF Transcript_13550/g.39068 Transcript_13550/m.39068 type:complete len:109 (-) Transcript_13550:680-1006(-)